LSVHVFLRLEARLGREAEIREALLRVLEPTRAESGCLSIHAFESIGEPRVFHVHSEWVSEAAFDLHATLPHMVRFLEVAAACLTHPVRGARTRKLD
jgi:quinol monooxygenase YgiN